MATLFVTPLSQESDSVHTSPREVDDQDHPCLVKLTLTYIKRYCGYKYRGAHFTKFLKENGIITCHTKALRQLDSFLNLYFPGSVLRKTFVLPNSTRYLPYPRSPLGPKTVSSSYSEEDIPSTPPSTPPTSQLKRAGSLMEIDSSIAQSVAQAPVAPVSVNINVFNGPSTAHPNAGSPAKPQHNELDDGFNQLMRIKAFLPDDSKIDLKIPSNATVSDLRSEVQKQMLARYPTKTEDDIPLERLHIKTRGGWPLNIADRLSAVIHETTVIQSFYSEY